MRVHSIGDNKSSDCIPKENDTTSNTNATCWLCSEPELQKNPFVRICSCIGSNKIHSYCLLSLIINEIKADEHNKRAFPERIKLIRQHNCKICKDEYSSHQFNKYGKDCSISSKNLCFFVTGVISLIISVGLFAVTLAVLLSHQDIFSSDKDSNSIQQIQSSLIIFLGIISLVVILMCLALAVFMFFKAFWKQFNYKIILESKDLKFQAIYTCNFLNQTEFVLEELSVSNTKVFSIQIGEQMINRSKKNSPSTKQITINPNKNGENVEVTTSPQTFQSSIQVVVPV